MKLSKAIDKLITDIESSEWKDKLELIETRPDADRVHSEDFFFFNINVHRAFLLIVFNEEVMLKYFGSVVMTSMILYSREIRKQ